MSAAREFELGDILSVTTGVMVTPRLMEGLYDICQFMAGEQVWTHQLPRVMREAAPVILRQHPGLSIVDASSVTPDNWREWLDAQVAAHGAALTISPMTEGDHERIDPLSELAEKVHPDRIIVV